MLYNIYLVHTYTAFPFPVHHFARSLRKNITIQSFTQLFQRCLKLAKYSNAGRLNFKGYQITARGSDTCPTEIQVSRDGCLGIYR